jgi:hypothetical protein
MTVEVYSSIDWNNRRLALHSNAQVGGQLREQGARQSLNIAKRLSKFGKRMIETCGAPARDAFLDSPEPVGWRAALSSTMIVGIGMERNRLLEFSSSGNFGDARQSSPDALHCSTRHRGF